VVWAAHPNGTDINASRKRHRRKTFIEL